MTTTNLFEGRNALIFASTGAISGAVATELARQGARVFLSARSRQGLEQLADRLRDETRAEIKTCLVNAEDQDEVEFYLQSLAREGVSPDLVFNGIGVDPIGAQYGHPSETITLDRFLEPLTRIVGSQFLTSTLAAVRMMQSKRGTILLLTSSLARSAFPYMAGITAASDAVEGLARVLAAEYAPRGVRVVCVRVDAIPETRTIRLSMAANAETLGIPVEEFASAISQKTRSARVLTLSAAARAIVVIASDAGDALSGQPVDIAYP